jgi:hypothetical protein
MAGPDAKHNVLVDRSTDIARPRIGRGLAHTAHGCTKVPEWTSLRWQPKRLAINETLVMTTRLREATPLVH